MTPSDRLDWAITGFLALLATVVVVALIVGDDSACRVRVRMGETTTTTETDS